MGYNKEDDIKALNKKETELIEAGIGEQKDFEGKDLKGKVAVVKRGSIAFVDKADNAKKAGAIGMVVYNNAPGEIEANVPGMSVPTIKLSSEDGEKLVSQLKAGGTKATFNLSVAKSLTEQMADFSSRGSGYGHVDD